MQTCVKCKVNIKGNHKICPLCGGILQEDIDHGNDVYPQIPTIFQEFNLFIRIMLLVSISAIVISIAINELFAKRLSWSLLVAAGILCMWISMIVILRKKNNIPKTILWQVVLISILSVLWDWKIGWIGWSIDYVLPSACVGAMIVMAASAKMLKIGVGNLTIYLLVDGLFGFVPVLFILFGWVHIMFPSIICVALSAISLAALILFQWDNMKTELDKRMHL